MSSTATAPPTSTQLEELADELLVDKTILNSLQDQPVSAERNGILLTTRKRILSLQRQIQAIKDKNRPRSQGNSSCASQTQQPRIRPPRRRPTAFPMDSNLDSASRKRSLSALDDYETGSGMPKSQRTSPAVSPFFQPAASSRPAASGALNSRPDEYDVIDLTGDDDDYVSMIERQKAAEERFGKNKRQADGDATLAQSLQASNQSLPALRTSAPDDIVEMSWRPRTTSTQSPSINPPLPSDPDELQMLLEDDDPNAWARVLDAFDPRPSPAVQTFSLQSPSYPVAFGSLPFMHTPAVESARQAAIARSSSSVPYNCNSMGSLQAYQPNPVQPLQQPQQPDLMAVLARSSSSASYNRSMGGLQTYQLNPVQPPQQLQQPDSMAAMRDWALRFNLGGPPVAGPSNTAAADPSKENDSLASIINLTSGYDYLNMVDVQGQPLSDRLVNSIDDFVNDPRRSDQQIKDLLSNIRPDMEIPEEERGETPPSMRYALYPHQQLSLKWMTSMETGTNKGGILADDMGLGKTISTLALMSTRRRPSDDAGPKTNLIIGPVALIKQWELEIQKKLKPDHAMSVCLLHGKKIQYPQLVKYDVVLTTYGTIAQEWKRFDRWVDERQRGEGYSATTDAELHKRCPLIHPKSAFWRVILDEAQCIKNKDTQAAKGAAMICTRYRWCLTGTPMMNGVMEMYSLCRFLRVKPYANFERFQLDFGGLTKKNQTGYSRDGAMQKLRVMLKAIMLRRMKTSQIDGKPILTLPDKIEVTDHVVFSDDEKSYYSTLESKSQVVFNRYLRTGTVGRNYSSVLLLLLRLRQACCHPHLHMDIDYVGSGKVNNGDASAQRDAAIELAKALDDAVITRLKAMDAFECPICYDAVTNPCLFFPCGHDTCSECLAKITDNALRRGIQAGDEGGSTARCHQCRQPVNPQKVFSYAVFKEVHMPETAEEEEDGDAAADDGRVYKGDGTDSSANETTASEESEDEDDDDSDADEFGDLRDFIVPDSAAEDDSSTASEEDETKTAAEAAEALMAKKKAKTRKMMQKRKNNDNSNKDKKKRRRQQKKANKGKAKAEKEEEVKPHELAELRIQARKKAEARRRYMRYLHQNWQPSAKVTKCTEIMAAIQAAGTGEKTIIFSQWTALLDLVEVPLQHELGIRYARYDGTMPRPARDAAVCAFVDDPAVTAMLVSLRAGNAGLNLTAANHIIILDPFWNPYIEMQAVDRAHRIGQQRPVHVHRILIRETVEDRIVCLQERKRELVDAALDEGENKAISRLSTAELAYLFGVSGSGPSGAAGR